MLKQFLLGALTVALVGCGGGSTSESHAEAARLLIAQGDSAGAVIELKNALQLDGANGEARFQLGKIYLDAGQILESEKELRRAAQLGVSDDQVQPVLANVLLPLRKFEELEGIQIDTLSDDSAAEVLTMQGLAKLSDGELDASAELLQQALEKNPASITAMIAKARLHGANSELSTMREQLQSVLELDPENSQAWTLVGDVEQQQDRRDLAMEAYASAIEYGKRPLDPHLKRAYLLIQDGDFESAQKDIDVLMKVAPNNPSVNYAQGLIYFQSQEYEKAVTAFAVSERDKKNFPLALLFAGTSHFVLGSKDQAEGYANQFHAIASDNVAGRKLLSTIIQSKGEHERVESLMRPVIERYPNDIDGLNLLANSLMAQNKTDEALDLLAKVAELAPDSSAAQIRLGAGMLASGDQSSGIASLQSALKIDPQFQQADILLVLSYMQQGETEQALAAAKEYRTRNPVSVAPLNLLGRVHLAMGDEALAKESFEKALTIEPGDPAAHSNLAQLARNSEQLDVARQHYEQILKYNEDFLSALVQLASLDAMANDEAAMVSRLEQAIAAHPEALEPKLILARYYLSTDRAQKVPVLFTELDSTLQDVPAVLNVIALSQLAEKDYAAARFTLEKLKQVAPGSAQMHHQMAMAQAGLNNPEKLQEELEQSIALDPEYLPARLALARLLVSAGKLDEAKVHLGYLSEVAPDFPDVLFLEASVARLEGKPDQALAALQLAFEKLPNETTLVALTGQYNDMQRSDEAHKLLTGWVADQPQDILPRMALAESWSRRGATDKSVLEYKEVLKLDDSNMIALNNLGWHLTETEPKLALRYAERANTLSPDTAEILDTLAIAQLKNDDVLRAQRSIERALELSPEQPSILYHSALIAVESGDKSAARGWLVQAMAVEQAFPERAEAAKLLKSIN
ncbi:XrtA/PEP-CTERM system TPR-repeat protein PrsT [Candidatus Litorirhabdus singularis]|nr:XrtA/PEP-CTERM system TPR-repeat protein PrsT [Candidatus Litorirhabdus singularis]